MILKKIGFGGGCHWCAEAYFQSLKGVALVEQGWVSANFPEDTFSEAVIVHYYPSIIPLEVLISVHLHTHASTKKHSFRNKYRSAVYVIGGNILHYQKLINDNQIDFDEPIITKALSFEHFQLNNEEQLNYYQKNKDNTFCERYISPKLRMLEEKYKAYYKQIDNQSI